MTDIPDDSDLDLSLLQPVGSSSEDNAALPAPDSNTLVTPQGGPAQQTSTTEVTASFRGSTNQTPDTDADASAIPPLQSHTSTPSVSVPNRSFVERPRPVVPPPAGVEAPSPLTQAFMQSAGAVAPTNPTPLQPMNTRLETIQIAPHPTTNRFPWAPVGNPTVAIPSGPPPQMPAAPQPTVMAPPQMPVVTPPPPAAPVMPVAPPPIPMPVSPPPPPPPPVMPVAPPLPPTPPPPPAPRPKPRHNKHAVHIYSDYTKEVWSVFRPSNGVRLFLLAFIMLVIGATVMFWWVSGAPTNILDAPFLQPLINAT